MSFVEHCIIFINIDTKILIGIEANTMSINQLAFTPRMEKVF